MTVAAGRPSATVVIPTYNAADTLARALASVEDAGTATEILVVDDGSADRDRLRALVAADPRAALIEKPARGNAAQSRAIGLARAAGDIVLFLDADDRFRPGHVARRIALHAEGDAGLILGRFRLADDSGERDGPMAAYPGGDVAAYIFCGGGDARSSTLSVRRDRLHGVTWDAALRKHQDWGFAIAVQRAGATIGFDPVAGVVIDIAGGGRMSGRSDVAASLAFMDGHLADPAIRRRFLIGRIRTSIRIGDLRAARQFRATLCKTRPSAKERALSAAMIAAARLGVAQAAWRLLASAKR